MPVPVNARDSGEFAPSLPNEREAEAVPDVAGWNVTVKEAV